MVRQTKDTSRQLRILSQSAILEEARTPYLVRSTMLIICFSFIAFVLWASFAQIKERATATGEIIPSGYIQTIQHLEGGIIQDILIHDDDKVRTGQVLIRLSGESVENDFERVQSKMDLLLLQQARLKAFLQGDQADFDMLNAEMNELASSQGKILLGMVEAHEQEKQIIQQQISQKREQLSLLQKELNTAKKNLAVAEAAYSTQHKLYNERLVAESTYLNVVRQRNEQQGEVDGLKVKILQAREEINEFEMRQLSLVSEAKNQALEKLGSLEMELADTKEQYETLAMKVNRLAIRAPTDGIVKGLEVHTIGGIVVPGKTIMEIVPTSGELLAQIKISPNDIGHIDIGHPVIVKITSYDFARYGAIDGTLTGLSATTFTNEQNQTFYQGQVTLQKGYVGNTPGKNMVLPGMIVNADIITGEKSLLEYFLKPIHKALNSAFIER